MDADAPSGTGVEPNGFEGTFAPAPRANVVGLEVEGATVIVAGQRRNAFQLDRIGTLVWSCFDGVSTLDEIIADLSDAFGTDDAVVRRDVLALVDKLGRAGLLAGVDADAPERADGAPGRLQIGTEVADFTLLDIDHREVSLSDFRGRPVVLVHWSPNCAFCRRIAPALAELQAPLDDRGTALVLLAGSGASFNRPLVDEHGLRCTLLLRTSRPFDNPFEGMGTPAAYLLDAEGRVAAPLASGANEVPLLVREAAGLPAIPQSAGAPVRGTAKFLEEPVSS